MQVRIDLEVARGEIEERKQLIKTEPRTKVVVPKNKNYNYLLI